MRHAGNLADGAATVEILVPGIDIGVHPGADAHQVVLGAPPFAIAREAVPGRGWSLPAPRPLVAGVGPEAGGLGLAGAESEHPDGCVIGEDSLG